LAPQVPQGKITQQICAVCGFNTPQLHYGTLTSSPGHLVHSFLSKWALKVTYIAALKSQKRRNSAGWSLKVTVNAGKDTFLVFSKNFGLNVT